MNTIAESIAITFVLITMAVSFYILYMKIESVYSEVKQMKETLWNLIMSIKEREDSDNVY